MQISYFLHHPYPYPVSGSEIASFLTNFENSRFKIFREIVLNFFKLKLTCTRFIVNGFLLFVGQDRVSFSHRLKLFSGFCFLLFIFHSVGMHFQGQFVVSSLNYNEHNLKTVLIRHRTKATKYPGLPEL